MRPDVEAVCRKMAEDLLARVVPAITPTYHQGTVGMMAAIFGIIAEEWDRAASRRSEENDRIRELFRDAASSVEDAVLGRRLLELGELKDLDLHIAALEQNNCRLRAALIELHADVEGSAGADARRIEAAIWKELLASTERRRLSSAQF